MYEICDRLAEKERCLLLGCIINPHGRFGILYSVTFDFLRYINTLTYLLTYIR